MSESKPFRFLTQKEAAALQEKMPSAKELSVLSDFFKMFGDHTRMRLLCLLAEKELCVGDIAIFMDSTPSAISHQLKTLRAARLVEYRRVGKTLMYSLADEHVQSIAEKGLEHIREL